jgi:predicted nucleic acid-binding Zn ribbon protein
MSDRRLWLEEACPTCGARSGLRCQTSRYGGKPSRVLHAARGWRQRSCPTCKAQGGELCKTPTGRRAGQPHTARLDPGRRELFAEQGVWEELGRWEAALALVRFSGGGGNQGNIAAVTLEDANKRELARWGSGEGELPEALAAPIWGRYALFRGHPRISGLLMWDASAGQIVVAGERGGQRFEEVLSAPRHPYRSPITSVAATARDMSRGSAPRTVRGTAPAGAPEASRLCERCGEPLPAGLRAEARYCSKRCRQAAARARLNDRPPSPPPSPVEACMWCGGPIPAGLRVEARFCSKRCRQASSRHALRVRRSSPKTSAPRDTSHPRDVKALG